MTNKAPESHQVSWTPDKSTRLWNYYSNSQHIEGMYFSKQVGHIVFNYAKRYVNMDQSPHHFRLRLWPGSYVKTFRL